MKTVDTFPVLRHGTVRQFVNGCHVRDLYANHEVLCSSD